MKKFYEKPLPRPFMAYTMKTYQRKNVVESLRFILLCKYHLLRQRGGVLGFAAIVFPQLRERSEHKVGEDPALSIWPLFDLTWSASEVRDCGYLTSVTLRPRDGAETSLKTSSKQ